MKKALFPILVVGICIGAKYYLQTHQTAFKRQNPDLKPLLASYQSHSIEKHSLGFNMLMGASLWIQLLQNSDYRPVTDEKVSWEFTQLDSLTSLDPNNNRAYEYGSIFISVLRRDKLGGKILLEKWTKKRPHYWKTWYLLGSHYFLELKDYATAGPLLLKAAAMKGAPSWLSSLGVRILSESGQYYQALQTSLELFPFLTDLESKGRLAFKIRALNYQLQKKYWNDSLASYFKEHKRYPNELSAIAKEFSSHKRELSSLTISNTELADESRELLAESFSFTLSKAKNEVISLNPEKTRDLESLRIFVQPNAKEPANK